MPTAPSTTRPPRQQALADRDAGALLLRDAGSPADTRWVQEREDLPRLVRAGRHIARTRRYIRNYAWEVEPEHLVAQVRLEARAGDGWVKLVGDWIDRDTGDLAPCWPADVLAQAVAAAHEEGARVTAHCFGEESLRDLAAAGTDCVEHATGLTRRHRRLVRRPRASPSCRPWSTSTPSRGSSPRRRRSSPTTTGTCSTCTSGASPPIAAAHEAGIPVYVGTDAGGSLPHGLVATEVARLGQAGLSPAEALDAACWGARAWLGWPGLEEGDEADLVVYAAGPARGPRRARGAVAGRAARPHRRLTRALDPPRVRKRLPGRPLPHSRRDRQPVPPLVRGALTSRDISGRYLTDNVAVYKLLLIG